MRTSITIAVVSFGLLACNQIAGIQKPNSGSSTGTFSTDLVADQCDDPCSSSQTCRIDQDTSTETTTNWACSAIGGLVEGASCSGPTECGLNLECFGGTCVSYCDNPGESCGNDGKKRTCVGAGWGACLKVCSGASDCSEFTGYACRQNNTDPGPGGGVCAPSAG